MPTYEEGYDAGFKAGAEAAAKIADMRASQWTTQTWNDSDRSCALPLAEECEDLAVAIRTLKPLCR